MDRIVWLIVLTVVANLILEFSGVLAETTAPRVYGSSAAAVSPHYLPRSVENRANAVNPDDVELVDPMQTSPSEGRSSRIKLFDNIFRV